MEKVQLALRPEKWPTVIVSAVSLFVSVIYCTSRRPVSKKNSACIISSVIYTQLRVVTRTFLESLHRGQQSTSVFTAWCSPLFLKGISEKKRCRRQNSVRGIEKSEGPLMDTMVTVLHMNVHEDGVRKCWRQSRSLNGEESRNRVQ